MADTWVWEVKEKPSWEERELEVIEYVLGLLRRETSPGIARVISSDTRVRSLSKLMQMELSAILAALRRRLTLKKQGADRIVDDEDTMKWNLSQGYGHLAEFTEELFDPCHAVAGLLHRAARCCRRTTTEGPQHEIDQIVGCLAHLTGHPLMYKHRLLADDDGDDTASTLSRAYHHLPYCSKPLSLYMVSMFPQGYKFDKNRLIWKWASERLTGKFYWFDSLRKAEVYFSGLVNREVIIQAANYGHKPVAGAEDCRWQVNPDMLQLLASESAAKGFVCTSRMLSSAAAAAAAAGGDSDSTEILRRLSLHQPDPELPTLLETMDISHIRSLAVSGAVDRIPLGKFIYLSLLDLEGWKNLKDEDLRQICSTMFVLRYLSVRNTGVTRLPPEIKELRYLEALDVSHTKISELPPEACKLEELQALDLRSTQVRQLPEQIAKLRKLCSLLVGGDGINPDETVAKIPEGILRATFLRVLASVDLSEWSASFIEALGGLRCLQVLVITLSFRQCADGEYGNALRSSIERWNELKSLTIHCGLGCSMEFLVSLDSPPQKLEKFKVTTGRFVTVPQWIKGLEHLYFLQITVCKLGADDIKILGELHKLRCLVLGLAFNPEQAIVIEVQRWFRQLRTFSVDCPVPWLTFGEGAMPELTCLDLEICSGPPKEESVPSGITNLGKLREVDLRYSKWCRDSSSVKMTVEAVKQEVAKYRGPIKLVINGTQHGVQAEAVDEETVRKTTTEIQSETEIEEIESEA